MNPVMTDASFGIVGKDFVMLAADKSKTSSIIILDFVTEKIREISDNVMMACIGELASTMRFADYVERRCKLYETQNKYRLSGFSTARLASGFMAECNRSINAFLCSAMIGVWEEDVAPCIYCIDRYGGMVKIPKYVGQNVLGVSMMGLLGELWMPDLTQEQAYDIMKKCVTTMQERYLINMPAFSVKVLDKNGVQSLPAISTETLAIEKYEARSNMEETL